MRPFENGKTAYGNSVTEITKNTKVKVSTPEARPTISTHSKHFQKEKNIFYRKKR